MYGAHVYQYVAFLRAINTGRRRVKNDELCSVFQDVGLIDIWGFLASGNVVFRTDQAPTPDLEEKIEHGLEKLLGYLAHTFIRPSNEVKKISGLRPIHESGNEADLQVGFLKTKPQSGLRSEALAQSTESDKLSIVGRQLYWLPQATIAESNLSLKGLAEVLGPMTLRTHRTVVRLAAKLES